MGATRLNMHPARVAVQEAPLSLGGLGRGGQGGSDAAPPRVPPPDVFKKGCLLAAAAVKVCEFQRRQLNYGPRLNLHNVAARFG